MRFTWEYRSGSKQINILDSKQGAVNYNNQPLPIAVVFDADLAERIINILNKEPKDYRRSV